MRIKKWIDIKGYKGLYQVSKGGQVRSLQCGKKLLKLQLNDTYLRVNLYNKSLTKKNFNIHRLVGKAFVKGYKPGLQINHKDGNPLNNNDWNLEWCTCKENIYHSKKVSKNGAIISVYKMKALYLKNAKLSSKDLVKLFIKHSN